MNPATWTKSASIIPRVVIAGVPDTHATRRQRALVSGDAVPVQADGDLLGDLLDLGAGEGEGAHVEEDQVVVRAAAGELVAALRELRGHGAAVLDDLLGVGLEGRAADGLQLHGERSDLVVVRSALERGETGLVDAGGRVLDLPVRLDEDHARARSL